MSGWTTKKLGEVCEVTMGASPDSKSYNSDRKGLPFYQGKTEFGKEHPTPVKWCDEPVKVAHAGDVLLSVRAPIGPVNFANEKCCIGRGLAALRFSGEQRFLYYLLQANEAELDSRGTGTTFKCISGQSLRSLPIIFPPLAEQKRIVAKIDAAFEKIDKLKANSEKNLANAKELFQSALDEAMRPRPDWIEKRLGDVCEIERGRSKARPRNLPELYGGPYPFVQTGDIKKANGGTISTFTQTYSEKGLKQSRLWKKGTLCVAIAANIGDSAILGFDACFPDSIVGISPNSMVSLRFINRYFCAMKDHLIEVAPGTAQKNFNVERLAKIVIALPSLEQQYAIAEQLDILAEKIHLLERNYARQVADCAEMRQAILREAFEGRM